MSNARRCAFVLALAATALAPPAANAAAAPNGFAAAYLAGHVAERRGEDGMAAALLAEALSLAPETPELRRRVVRLQAMDGDFAAAASGAETLASEGDDNFPIGLLRLTQRFKTGDFNGAAALAENAAANGLAPMAALLAHAWALAGAGDVDGGAKILTDAAKEHEGQKVLLTLHAGLLAEQGGRAEVARWMYEEAMAASMSDQALPAQRLVQIVVGYYERAGLTDEAAAARASAPEGLLVGEAAAEPVVRDAAGGVAEAFFNFAGSLYSQRQYRQALVYARLSETLRPDDPIALFTIGQIMEALGRPQAAAEVYRKTPPVGAFRWRAPMRVAESLADAGDQEAAIAAMRAVVEAAPEEPGPAIALGHMLRNAKRFAEAVDAYDEAVRRKGGLGPDDGWLRYARGVALERSGDWPEAEAEFLKALETLGDEPLVLNYLGYTWIDRGEHLDRARGMVARAVELRPEDGFIRDSLGWAEYRLGDFQAAAATLEQAVALQPLDPIVNEHLGDAYWQVGRYREARFQWRRALSFEPEAAQIPIIENKLKCGLDGCPAAAGPAVKPSADGG